MKELFYNVSLLFILNYVYEMVNIPGTMKFLSEFVKIKSHSDVKAEFSMRKTIADFIINLWYGIGFVYSWVNGDGVMVYLFGMLLGVSILHFILSSKFYRNFAFITVLYYAFTAYYIYNIGLIFYKCGNLKILEVIGIK